jgi:type I restriction enzyme M protein
VLLNASRRVQKGRPKNFVPEDVIRPLAAAYLKGEPVEGEITVITRQEAERAEYNLSPSRWIGQNSSAKLGSVSALVRELTNLDGEGRRLSATIQKLLAGVANEPA